MLKIDKIIRVTIGTLVLIYFGLLHPTWWAFLGLIPLMSGVSEFCPIYKFLKKDFKKNELKQEDIPKVTSKKRKFLKLKKEKVVTTESLFKN